MDLDEVASEIIRRKALLGVSEIVLGAFAHLSEKPTDPITARQILDGLSTELQITETVIALPFGWDKSLDIHVPLHHYNASGLYFKPISRFRNFFQSKMEWVKLNASYLAGTITGTMSAFTAAYLSERFGVDRTHATTWIASTVGFITGTIALVSSWLLFHKDIYKENKCLLWKDTKEVFKNTLLAQAITWLVVWPIAGMAAFLKAPNWVCTLINQVVDRIIFIPALNLFSKKHIKEIEEQSQK